MRTLTIDFKGNITQVYEIEDMNSIHIDKGFLMVSVPHEEIPLKLTYWFINVDSILQFSVE